MARAWRRYMPPALKEYYTPVNWARTFNDFDPEDKINTRVLSYWVEKDGDPGLHPGQWGGSRWSKLTVDEDLAVRVRLWKEASVIKSVDIHELAIKSSTFVTSIRRTLDPNAPEVVLSDSYIRRIFHDWDFTWKLPVGFNIAKFTPLNNLRYVHFTTAISHIPRHRLKYLDEAHIASNDLRNARVLSKRGKRTFLIRRAPVGSYAHVVLLTSPNRPNNPFVIHIHTEMNTGIHFADFVVRCVVQGDLVPGDFLIIDRARVHFSQAVNEELTAYLMDHGVIPIFLPAYSPELNPCELCYNVSKNKLRKSKFERPFPVEVARSFQVITPEKIASFYEHCIENFGVALARHQE